MNILSINNLGTILYTIFFGKEMGRDKLGNRYYVLKNNIKKRWVIYKNEKDPTVIPIKWQIWLTSDSEQTLNNNQKFNWEKDRKQNLTGTSDAYHPVKMSSKLKSKTKTKYKSWDPS